MPAEIFNFTGQAKVDTFAIDLASLLEQRAYDAVMVNKYRLALEAIRSHANEFSFWQRQKSTGRPPVLERDLLVAFPRSPAVRCHLPRNGGLVNDAGRVL
jgi:hypothetical protein